MIGTGTSAIQLIPELAQSAAELQVFQRTPVWVLPRPDFAIPNLVQRLFAWIPPLRLAVRAALYLQLEALSLALLKPRTAFWAKALARWHLRRQVPDPARQAALTPDYPIGCKRIALASNFYPALMRANVQLETGAIASIEPAGVRMLDGRFVALDVLVYATASPMDLLAQVDVDRRQRLRLAAHWRDPRRTFAMSLTANGIAVPGFRIFFSCWVRIRRLATTRCCT